MAWDVLWTPESFADIAYKENLAVIYSDRGERKLFNMIFEWKSHFPLLNKLICRKPPKDNGCWKKCNH